jgi:hypothetical protein
LFIKVVETAKSSTIILGAKAIFIASKQKDNRQTKTYRRVAKCQTTIFIVSHLFYIVKSFFQNFLSFEKPTKQATYKAKYKR